MAIKVRQLCAFGADAAVFSGVYIVAPPRRMHTLTRTKPEARLKWASRIDGKRTALELRI